MWRSKGEPDKLLLILAAALVFVGLVIFSSAAFGLLTRGGASFGSVIFSQLVLGLLGGGVLAYFVYNLNLKKIRPYGFHIFVFSILVSLLVFIPGVGFEWAGAKRWVLIAGISFQPVELLKIGMVLFLASWLSGARDEVGTLRYGLLPFGVTLAVVSGLLLAQPDNGSFLVIVAGAMTIFLVAGAKWKHLLSLLLAGIVAMALIIAVRPYVLDRLQTFLNPSLDPLGSSYQIRQSLIAIGSGEAVGRGFGQSIQKFQYLPEPIGDSIFAVFSEEFGFVGASLLLVIYLAFALRALRLSIKATDMYNRLLIVGIVSMIMVQSFLNIGAMVGILPLTGIPLVFVSHGGTALAFALISVALILNASKQKV